MGKNLHELDEMDKILRYRRALLLRVAVQYHNSGGPRSELNVVTAVMNDWFAIKVVKIKFGGCGIQRLANQLLRYARCHFFEIDGRTGGCE